MKSLFAPAVTEEGCSVKGRKIAYYVSAHGYGHGVRSSDIIRAVFRQASDIEIVLVSTLPPAFLENRLRPVRIALRDGQFDVGMVQLDSIRVDVEATRRRVEDLCARWDVLVGQEVRWLREQRVGMVVCDIPAIPIDAAKCLGLPAVVVANFSWDWIYEEFAERDPRWRPFVERFARAYAQTDLLLKLPFSGEMEVFPRRVEIPLVATPGRPRREDLARVTGADSSQFWVLLSFTTLAWDDAALRRVQQIEGYEFFTVQPLEWEGRNLHAVNREVIPFSDVLASVDIVVSKPGFGLLSECVVNKKPLVYADRSDFREYAILEREMKRCLPCVHISSDALYQGELEPALRAALKAPAPAGVIPADGGVMAAKQILQAWDGGC